MTPSTQISLRLDADVLEHADRIAEQLSKATIAGLEPTRAAVLRAAIARGLDAMQAELDAKTKPRSKR